MIVAIGEVGDDVDAYLALEALAAAPFDAFVYADAAAAARARRARFDRDLGEAARRFARLARRDGAVVGALAFVPGRELAPTRLKTAWAIRREPALALDADEARRSALAGGLLARLDPDDVYLARIAVDPAHRGTGVAAALLAHLDADARGAGARRIVLEVSPDRPDAVRLYERADFVPGPLGEAVDPPSGRRLAYRQMARILA